MSTSIQEIVNTINSIPLLLAREGYVVVEENGEWKFNEDHLRNYAAPTTQAPVLHVFTKINENQAREIMALSLTSNAVENGLYMMCPRGHYYATYYKGRQYLRLEQKTIIKQIKFTSTFAYARDFVGKVEDPWIINLE